jgi:nucleotide-binding universal stress UspA family protein
MSYKSLLIHVEPTDAGRERLRTAIAITGLFGGRLIGIGACAGETMPDPTGLSAQKLKAQVDAEIASAEAVFHGETAALGASAIWRSEVGYPTHALLRHVAAADLIIAPRNVEAEIEERQVGAADLLMGAGVPILSAPTGAKFDAANIIIGWKNTRETRRAIADSMSFLKRAESVRLVSFGEGDDALVAEMSDVVDRLKLHGAPAEGEVLSDRSGSVADDLCSVAKESGAGLIVVGGYGHSRLREWALGGVTQGLLNRSDICVLFSH